MTACRFVSTTEPRVISGRHQDPCACDGERGCLRCTELHCCICQRAHVDRNTCPACLDAARSDLQAIGDLCLGLPEEAAQKGVQSEAMVLLGPVADPEAWQHRAMSAAMGRVDAAYLEDCRDESHPLFVLGGWEQIWRDFLDHPSEERITIQSAGKYLDMQIGYMADQVDPAFDEFARELRQCRGHLEDVLRDGIREERGQAPCVECGVRLVRVFADSLEQDHWTCPRCRRTYTDQEYARAQHFHMEDERAGAFVKVSVALGMIDRPEQTLRTWMANGRVKTERDPRTGSLLVWWPDVRDMNRDTKTRRRRSA